MRIRLAILFILTTCLHGHGNAQKPLSIAVSVGSSYSWLGMNKQSKYYNSNWERTKNTFSPEFGYSIGLGINKKLNDKFTLSFIPRYQYWGGNTKTQSQVSNFYLAFAITYHSFRLPVLVDYSFYRYKQLILSSSVGLGMDYTYDLTFIPSTQYGAGNPQKRNVGITTPFVALGLNMTYQQSTDAKLAYQLTFSFETDYFLNPNRFNDFGGYFGQEKIPLYSFITNTNLKLIYRL
jgi:hypothetical protein